MTASLRQDDLILDLFAGPGGWDVAATELGLRPIGVEYDAAACATRAAAGHLTIRADVATIATDPLGDLDGLIASPPCPTFSLAGKGAGREEMPHLIAHVHACTDGWRPYTPPESLGLDEDGEPIAPDQRSAFVLEPLRFALECSPRWIALEQVPDVLPVWEAIAHVLRDRGYSVWCGVLNAADYGVPQTRRRAILMAHRDRIVAPPAPTHCEGGALGLFGELAPWVTMAEALGWGATEIASPTVTAGGASGWVAKHGDRPDRGVDDPAPTLTGEAHRWGFERPSTTVQGDPRIAPPGHRDRAGGEPQFGEDALRLTAEDALRLQSFPADYPVQGSKSKKFQQIGNAVPPLLARAILAELIR